MPTDCTPEQLRFEGFAGRQVVGGFDGGAVTSNAGALALREADRAIGLSDMVARCFADSRQPGLVREHRRDHDQRPKPGRDPLFEGQLRELAGAARGLDRRLPFLVPR